MLIEILVFTFILFTVNSNEELIKTVLSNNIPIHEDTLLLRHQLDLLTFSGRHKEVLNKLSSLEKKYGNLQLDNMLPSLYMYRGISFHGLHRLREAEEAFNRALEFNKNDTRSWINKGEMLTLQMKFHEAVPCFMEAYTLGERLALTRLLSSKGWVDSWDNFEYISAEVEKEAYLCLMPTYQCSIESAFGFEYTDIPGYISKLVYSKASYSSNNRFIINPKSRSQIVKRANHDIPELSRRLRLGVISSDFGVHPVSSLVRGLLQLINREEIELFCFSVTGDLGWWGINISLSVEHFNILSGVNTQEGASIIASKKIDILIDLNGHTKNSGLAYMSHRPAPIQMSYLGLPSTTGSPFINYYIGDFVALPPEISNHFTENLVLLSPSYIVNDYANLQGEIVSKYSSKYRMDKYLITSDYYNKLLQSRLLYGTISNSQKLDPYIFIVWMNILSKYPGNNLLFIEHKGFDSAILNLRKYSKYFGISSNRLLLSPHTPWIDHIYKKTAIDLLFDTITKNGHTTGLDGIWAGVPLISLAGGKTMPQRAGESISRGLNNEIGLVYSLKEYEDLADRLSVGSTRFIDNFIRFLNIMKGNNDTIYFYYNTSLTDNYVDYKISFNGIKLLRIFRDKIQSDRLKSTLFNTPLYTHEFTRKIQSVYDIVDLSIQRSNSKSDYDNDPYSNNYEYFYGGMNIKLKKSNFTNLKRDDNSTDMTNNIVKTYHIFAKINQSDNPNYKRFSQISLGQAYDYRSIIFKSPNNESSIDAVVDSHHNLTEAEILSKHSSIQSSDLYTNLTSELSIDITTEQSTNVIIDEYYKENDNYQFVELPDDIFENDFIFLNIGGIKKAPGWLNVNVQDQPYVGIEAHTDIIRPMYNLHGFPNYSVSAIYSAHNLEHNPIHRKLLFNTLLEWRRVLRPAGLLMLSVPDLRTLAKIYLNDSLSFQDRWMTTMMIYGSQSNEFDYHFVGFDESILTSFLADAGFCNIERVKSFNLFEDASTIIFQNQFISLNLVAKRCITEDDMLVYTGELKDIKHNATPYER